MTLNIFTDIGAWFTRLFRKIGFMIKPITDWFSEITKPIREFLVENARNPFLWIGIILVALIVFELTYKVLNKDRG